MWADIITHPEPAARLFMVGRALDIHFAEDMGEADNDLGDALANYLSKLIWVFSVLSGTRVFGQRAAGCKRASTAESVPIRITFIWNCRIGR